MSKKITKNIFIEAIKNSGGVLSIIAHKLGVTRGAVTHYIDKNEDLLPLIQDEKEQMLDLAENKLGGLIDQGEFNAIRFYLKTKGKARGYIEEPQVQFNSTSQGGPTYSFEIVKPDDNTNKVETKP